MIVIRVRVAFEFRVVVGLTRLPSFFDEVLREKVQAVTGTHFLNFRFWLARIIFLSQSANPFISEDDLISCWPVPD